MMKINADKLIQEGGNNSFLRGVILIFKTIKHYFTLFILNNIFWGLFFILPAILTRFYSYFFDLLNSWKLEGLTEARSHIISYFIPVVILTLLYSLNMYMTGKVTTTYFQQILFNFRRNILSRLFKFKSHKLDMSMGEAINSMREDPNMILSTTNNLMDTVSNLLLAIWVIGSFALIDVTLTLTVLVPFIIIVYLAYLLRNKLSKVRKDSREKSGDISAFIGDIFSNIQTIKVNMGNKAIMDKFSLISEERRKFMIKDTLTLVLLQKINRNVSQIGTVIALLVVADKLKSGAMSQGDFILVISLLPYLTNFFVTFGFLLNNFVTSTVSFDRMYKLTGYENPEELMEQKFYFLDNNEKRNKYLTDNELKYVNHLKYKDNNCENTSENTSENTRENSFSTKDEILKVKNLSLAFQDKKVLKDISFSIKKGEFFVVTGRTGSGKTVLIDSIIGNNETYEGDVYYNGERVSLLTYPKVSVTYQEPAIFSESIGTNIALNEINEDKLIEAIKNADLEMDIKEFNEGYNTLTGTKGVKISGGQRQRIGIARMIYNSSPLYILDNVSSALDVDTELKIWNNLKNLKETVLAVSTKKPAFHSADKILVLKEGKIDSFGTLDEVLKTSNEFRSIYGKESNDNRK